MENQYGNTVHIAEALMGVMKMIAFKGKMPQGCGACPLSYLDRDEDDMLTDICCLTNHYVWNDFTERAEDCPLIEVNIRGDEDDQRRSD